MGAPNLGDMIPQTKTPLIRKSAAIAGVVGILALAGCSGIAEADTPTVTSTTDTSTSETTTTDSSSSSADSSSSTADSSSDYEDGSYTAEGSYQTPETVEQIRVTLTLEDGVVTDVEVTGDPQARESQQYQSAFIANIAAEVVGVAIDDLDVDKVAGSSLTSGGFNAAVEDIKAQALAA